MFIVCHSYVTVNRTSLLGNLGRSVNNVHTYSRTSIFQPSIIWLAKVHQEMGMTIKCTYAINRCYHGDRPVIFCACI